MKNFYKIKYERCDYDKIKIEIDGLIIRLKSTKSFNKYISIIYKINKIHKYIEEMYDYADICNMRDLDNQFYKDEIDYWNEYKSKFDLLFISFYEEINSSKFKDQLREVMPSNFFTIIEYQLRLNSKEVIDLIKEENELKTKYRNLDKEKVLFDGKEYSFAELGQYLSNKDRDIRKKAHDALNDFYYSKQSIYDDILFNLVNVRNKISQTLGFSNYVQYSLLSLKRIGYDYKDITKFREYVIKYIVPICEKLRTWQKEELDVEELKYYDTVFYQEMPNLKYNGKKLLREFKKIFENVDSEASKLYNDMLLNKYIDLETNGNKVNFAITNYLVQSGLPVITGNFKNSYMDVIITSHEFGHSIQKYCSSKEDKKYIVSPLLKYATMEIAEMFSYSMELILIAYVRNLFKTDKDYKKYSFMKMYNLVIYLPYICLVDEFQERIYNKENLKVEELREVWLELVKKYLLEQSNSGHINLDSGGYFYRQSHIFLNPFYYIDYALSYFGAFTIWNKCENDLSLFKELGSVASYYSFKDLIDKYNMPNPFDENTVKNIAQFLDKELEEKRVDN